MFLTLFISFALLSDSIADYDIIDNIFQMEEADYSDILEHLEDLSNKKLNINTATRLDLENLLVLNDLQIDAILHYISTFGSIMSSNEMLLIRGITPELMSLLQNYIVFEQAEVLKLTWANIKKYNKSDLLLRYSRLFVKKKGFIEDENGEKKYLGSRDEILLRYRFNVLDKLKIGLNANKNEGEEFFAGHQKKGFPVYSGFIQLKDVGIVESAVLGHYRLQFGQGLTLWQGMTYGVDAGGLSLKRSAGGVVGVAASSDYGYMQGVAASLNFKQFNLSLFASIKQIDGTIKDTNEEGKVLSISSILESGYQRSLNEIQKKRVAWQAFYGGHLEYRGNNFKIGSTFHYNNLNVDYSPNIKLYNQFSVPPKHNINVGIDFEGSFSIFRPFGEIAMSKNLGLAAIFGSKIYLSQNFTANFLFRYYDKKYQNFFAKGFGANNNETAVTLGIIALLSKTFTLAATAELSNRQWLTFSADAPTYNQKVNIKLDYNPSYYLKMYLTYKANFNLITNNEDSKIKKISSTTKHNLRLNIDCSPMTNLNFISRGEINIINKNTGYILNETIKYRFLKFPLNFVLGFSIFDVDNYDLRIYSYENDVLYAFSSHSYFDKGYRLYATLNYEVIKNLHIEIKVSNTKIANKHIQSSGFEEFTGRNKPEIKVQIRYKF